MRGYFRHMHAWKNIEYEAMNLDETAAWINQLFPAEMNLREAQDDEGNPGFHYACFNLGRDFAASTLDFADIDTGLESEGVDVRCEIFTINRASETTTLKVLDATANQLARAEGAFPAQPGTLLPGIGSEANLPSDITVKHGVFVVPYVWGEKVPQLKEPDRWTLMLQLVMLTQEEFEHAVTYGVGQLQQDLAAEGIDLLDWSR